jgi:hypothetical protein
MDEVVKGFGSLPSDRKIAHHKMTKKRRRICLNTLGVPACVQFLTCVQTKQSEKKGVNAVSCEDFNTGILK